MIEDDNLKEHLGLTIKCPRCGNLHKVITNDAEGKPSIISWYKCGGVARICGIRGKSILHKVEGKK